MLLRLFLAAALAVGLSSLAGAQTSTTVAGCSGFQATLGAGTPLISDETGKLCVSGGGGGGATTIGSSSWPVAQQDGSVPAGAPFSASATGVLFSVDTTGYQSIDNALSGTFVGTVTYEASNDNTTWATIAGNLLGSTGANPPATTDTGSVFRAFPASARYFRARVSAYTSGTITATPILRSTPVAPQGVYVGGGSLGLTASTAVIGSTTLRAAGTNRSATVNTTAANLMAANSGRQGWKVKNDCANAIWINLYTTATATAGSGNIKIVAGSYLASEPGFVETGAMSAIAETSSCAITASEH